jgi:small GTP-binding protein
VEKFAMLKLVLIGNSGVGKTTINHTYIRGQKCDSLEPATIGAVFHTKTIQKGSDIIKLNIWDTAGQEKYASLASLYCRDACGCLCVFDVTNKESFDHLDKWLMKFEENALETSIIILVANKSESHESLWAVSRNQIISYAERNKLKVFFISGFDVKLVNKVYEEIISAMLTNNISNELSESIITILDDQLEPGSQTCYSSYC